MLAHSSDFKEAFTKLGRELYVKIEYKTSSKIITEDNKLLLTQNNMQLITELANSQDYEELSNDEIIALRKNNLGELWRTYMKSFDLDTIHEFFVGDIMHIYIGCKVDDDIEYLDYGNYIVYKKEYDENTKAWSYQLCDEMIRTMIPADIDEITDLGVSSCELFIRQILVYCGYTTQQISKLVTEKTKLANYNKKIIVDYARDMKVTCRDLLDYLLALNGVSLVMELDNGVEYLRYREIGTTIVDTLNEDILSGDNAKFAEQYGPVNCLVFKKAEGLDDLIKADQQSIEANGETQIIIDGNPFATQEAGEWEIEEEDLNYIDNLFDKIKGTSYYLCDFDTIGIGYLEYLDKFRISTPDHIYDTIVLQNTGEVGNGMNESFKINQVKETKQEYDVTQIDGKKASIEVDKLRGTIVLKTYEEDGKTKLAQVRLDSSGEDGSLVEISGDQIDLTGKNINLTSDDITISSDHFSVTKEGNMTCSNANITGGKIDLNTDNYDNYILVHSNNNKTEWNIGSTNIIGRNNGTQKIIMSSSTGSASFNEIGAKKLTIGLNGEIECYGSIWCQGNLQVDGSKNRVVDIGDKKILMNAYETATPYFGDIGSNKTNKDGECKIEIDSIFAQTICKDCYKVFIQECGEGKLWVEKHDNYFYVKGTPDLDFDWEIKAIQKGYENTRLEELVRETKEDDK